MSPPRQRPASGRIKNGSGLGREIGSSTSRGGRIRRQHWNELSYLDLLDEYLQEAFVEVARERLEKKQQETLQRQQEMAQK